ncbi:uncharacterized protein J4E88_010665 [Alternaria novae-zelandiae]|uniref:uncharacterized protein n=1 Tax=Alternaria novae-zelandiae TaxID=430562 RepID=UPI0020C4C041|nr:uncharacterized protein J4E88_010665 [Alternaria novae-zelandiae]KAI4664521.1 hypothetical protein J4E88_010665 [Alternaria novae-zelandiae]
MSPEQTAAYLARFRDRIATIRQNVTVVSLKGKFTNPIRRRDSVGRQGENARTALSASLGLYYTGVDKSEEDLRDLSPVGWEGGDGDGDGDGSGEDEDGDGRSDSMEPLRHRDRDSSSREDITNASWDAQWELDMDREEERLMRSEHRIAEERVGRKKGRELQSMLRGLGAEEWNGGGADEEAQNEEAQDEEAQNEEAQDEEAQNEEAQDEEAPHTATQDAESEDEEPPYPASQGNESSISLPSNPYPEDDFLLPLTRQPARTTPPPPFPSPPNLIIHPNSSPGLSIPSPGLSIPSNPYPEDAPSSPTSFSQPPQPQPQAPPPPRPTQSPSPYYRAYDAERVFGSVGESYEGGGGEGGEREDEVRRRYLNALSGEERRMAEQEEDEEFAMRTSSGETNAGRKNMMNRLLSTFACRPGTVTPLHTTTIPIPNDTNTPTTPAVPTTPKKYTIAYLSHKIHRTQKREEEAKLRERLMALRLAEPSAPQTHHIEDTKDISNFTEIPVLVPKPKAKRRKDSTQPNPPSLVPNLESRTQSVIGPPVGLSQMIQRAPGSVRVKLKRLKELRRVGREDQDKSTQVQVSATDCGKRNLKIYLCNRMQQGRYGI